MQSRMIREGLINLFIQDHSIISLYLKEREKASMSKVFDEIIQGMHEIVEFEQGKRTLRIDKILVVPLENFSPEEIRKIRMAVSLSQRSFASVIGVSPKTIESWEAGTNKPSGASSRMLQLIKEKPDITREFYTCTAKA
jgi:putative transcriptional regulator